MKHIILTVSVSILLSGCGALLKGSSGLVITNEHRGDCISAQPGRGVSELGRTREGAPCQSVTSMGMIPVFQYRW